MSTRRSTRHLSAWFAMLALVMNALLPLAAQAMRATSEQLGSMEICSSTGMVMIQPHDAGPDSPPGQAASRLKDCPFCHLHHDSTGLPPAAETSPILPATYAGMPPAFYQAARTSPVWLSAQPRAPPLLA